MTNSQRNDRLSARVARPGPSDARAALARGRTAGASLLFLPPALLLFTIFVILPMGEAAWY